MDLRSARLNAGKTQQEVADMIGCYQPNISNIERGVIKSGRCKKKYIELFTPGTDEGVVCPHLADWVVLAVGVIAAGFFLIETEPTDLLYAIRVIFTAIYFWVVALVALLIVNILTER